jgi:NAD(P)-dependent dehydrogenase (short-subunit alcohol dehydrogenase family)
LTSRVALVTGASRGIGRRVVEGFLGGFLDQEWTVVGVARSPVDTWNLPETDRFVPHACDVTDDSMVKRLFSDIRKRHGRLDVLINNVGAFSSDLLLSASADRFSTLLRANLVSAHVVTREAVKLMRAKGSGRVVSISSIATAIPLTGNALYATSKIALESLMRGFAVEFRGSGVTFNSVGVSFLDDTGMVDALKPEARLSYEQRLLVPHALSMAELMHAIRCFVADEAGAITGQSIVLGSPS